MLGANQIGSINWRLLVWRGAGQHLDWRRSPRSNRRPERVHIALARKSHEKA